MAGRLGGHSRGARRGTFSFLTSLFESTWPSILSQGGILDTLCLADATVKGGSVVPAHRPCPMLREGLMVVDLGLIHSLLPALGGMCEVGLGSLQPGGLRWDLVLPDAPVKRGTCTLRGLASKKLALQGFVIRVCVCVYAPACAYVCRYMCMSEHIYVEIKKTLSGVIP